MPAPGPTIARLASLAGGGDADALESLAARVQRTLEAHAQRALASQGRLAPGADDVAEEVVAEVQAFLAGAGGPPGWRRFRERPGGGALDGWLYGIVRNKVRRRLRDERRRERLLLQEAAAREGFLEAAPPPSPERAADAARALRLARDLPPRERAALALWLEDATSREIASRLRLASPHAAECCLSRGKQRLRRMMAVEPELPAAA